MTATHATRTPRKGATLVGIAKAQGDHCDDCSRELTARLFTVRVTATGELRQLGRRCAAYATGYPTTRVEHEARRAELLRQRDRDLAAGTVEQYEAHLRATNVLGPGDLLCVWFPERGEQWVPVAEWAAGEHARVVAALAAGDLD